VAVNEWLQQNFPIWLLLVRLDDGGNILSDCRVQQAWTTHVPSSTTMHPRAWKVKAFLLLNIGHHGQTIRGPARRRICDGLHWHRAFVCV